MPRRFTVLDPRLVSALDAGALVVTPNNRLARDIVSRYDALKRAQGLRAWPSARAMPRQAWLRSLWLDLVARAPGATPPVLLEGAASLHLWQSIVAADTAELLDARGAARQASDAWALFHAWRAPGEALRSRVARIDEDGDAFLRWAGRYARRLQALHAIDDAQVAEALTLRAQDMVAPECAIVLYGFSDWEPAQLRLLSALRANAWKLDEYSPGAVPAQRLGRIVFATPEEEMQQALSWARDHALRDGQARIGIVFEDLQRRRDALLGLAEEILCPERLADAQADATRPYGIS
ncbi:MAG TPA: hypothetical protein VMV45_00210, partial [Casimicrobiaceae bacterium]|nr:hypothetical protein [Casimicrobiaceae bacterium]